ncbi:MAG: hypothetical protein MHMPM18_000765 [Marteilia pararefringens]
MWGVFGLTKARGFRTVNRITNLYSHTLSTTRHLLLAPQEPQKAHCDQNRYTIQRITRLLEQNLTSDCQTQGTLLILCRAPLGTRIVSQATLLRRATLFARFFFRSEELIEEIRTQQVICCNQEYRVGATDD